MQSVWALLCLQCCLALHSILHFFCSCPSPSNVHFSKMGHVIWTDALLAYPAAHGSCKGIQISKCLKVFSPSHLHVFVSLKYPPLNTLCYMLLIFSWIVSINISRLTNQFTCLKTGFQQINILSSRHWLCWSASAMHISCDF